MRRACCEVPDGKIGQQEMCQPVQHHGLGLLQGPVTSKDRGPVKAQHMQAAVQAAGLPVVLPATYSLPDRPQEPLKASMKT